MVGNILSYLSTETARNILGWWTVLDLVSGYAQKAAIDTGRITRMYPTGIFTAGAAFVRWVREIEIRKADDEAAKKYISKL